MAYEGSFDFLCNEPSFPAPQLNRQGNLHACKSPVVLKTASYFLWRSLLTSRQHFEEISTSFEPCSQCEKNGKTRLVDLGLAFPDGIAGNLYVAHFGMQQVQVLNSDGQLVGHYQGGNLRTSNVAFGESRMNRLFVADSLKTGAGGLFRLDLNVNGLVILPVAP